MEMCFKFQQNRTMNEEFDFFRGWGPHLKILILIIISKHMKMLGFKFHQSRAINKEFDFWKFRREGGVLRFKIFG